MIKERNRAEGFRAVTVFAYVTRRKVIRCFAARGDAVVAAHTVRSYACVVEADDSAESRRQVAGSAIIAGWRVVDRLAGRGLVVVAAFAFAEGFRMVHALEWQETTDRMAARTPITGQNMTGRLGRCRDCARRRMAVLALTQCALEDAAAVTVSTTGHDVRAFEAKAGGIVVEVRTNSTLSAGNVGQGEDAEEQA